jgi:hypothetical protein
MILLEFGNPEFVPYLERVLDDEDFETLFCETRYFLSFTPYRTNHYHLEGQPLFDILRAIMLFAQHVEQ